MGILGMRLEGIDRRHVDDPARHFRRIDEALHVQHGGHHHVIGALDVDGVFEIPIGIGDLENGLARIDRRAVDERMDAPEPRRNFLEGGMGAFLDGDIAARGRDFGAEIGQDPGGFGESLLVLIDQSDLRSAALDHQFRGGEAKARSAAHDYRRLSLHSFVLAI
jgi:hypothetical protein